MQFELKVYRASEGVSLLQLDASDEADARRQAETQGYRVIKAKRKLSLSIPLGKRQRFSVELFSQELLALLDAGLSLVETVDILARKSRHADTQRILDALSRHLQEGLSFSRALEAIPGAFSPLFIATIRTTEHTGDLPEALRRYLAYHQQLNLVRDKIVSASVYPVLLISVGFLVMMFLMGYVVPRFSLVYEDLGDNLPWMSRMLMHWGQLFSQHAMWIICGLFTLVVSAIYGLTRPQTRAWVERKLWSLPTVGEKLRVYQLARFTRTLAMLINGGIPFVAALDMVQDLLRQPSLRQGLQQAGRLIREGRTASEAFVSNGLTTEVGVRLLGVGERSGNMGQTLERIANLYDDEISRWIEWFVKLFEPVLMIVIGVIVGVIVLMMYLPIFELASSIQ